MKTAVLMSALFAVLCAKLALVIVVQYLQAVTVMKNVSSLEIAVLMLVKRAPWKGVLQLQLLQLVLVFVAV